jgi:hypothetical protein
MALDFENCFPITMKVNITADRNTEGDAPDKKLKSHKEFIRIRGLIHPDFFLVPDRGRGVRTFKHP